jgi:hypothetical protein
MFSRLVSYLDMQWAGRSKRGQRILFALVFALICSGWAVWTHIHQPQLGSNAAVIQAPQGAAGTATAALARLPIKGRAPKTGYTRTQFSDGWEMVGTCDIREHILARDLTNVQYRSATDCTVLSGGLQDPYTGKTISFTRGPGTSEKVQIDHVVAISDAWQKGAQQLSANERHQLYNDPLELLAVDGPTNQQKGDGDAATWLPPNKAYRCRYVARQIAVKQKYHLWVTQAEHDAMQRILGTCPGQALPSVSQ